MKKLAKTMLLINIAILLASTGLSAQNSPPSVSSVQVEQRTGTKLVDITYDVNDADGDTLSIRVMVSSDGGNTFTLSATSITGDIAGVTSGSGKQIEWDAGVDYPNKTGSNFQIKVLAFDGIGGDYLTVIIGDQEWMLENLQVTHYRNGDPIDHVTDSLDWGRRTAGAYAVYFNNEAFTDTYGYFYNWFAVNDPRGLAPEGWHIPSDDEWKELEVFLGMTQSEASGTTWRGTDEGGKLKEAGLAYWDTPNTGATNEYGFTALPGGTRGMYDGPYYGLGISAYFWSNTSTTVHNAWYRNLSGRRANIGRFTTSKLSGFSVRCIKDK